MGRFLTAWRLKLDDFASGALKHIGAQADATTKSVKQLERELQRGEKSLRDFGKSQRQLNALASGTTDPRLREQSLRQAAAYRQAAANTRARAGGTLGRGAAAALSNLPGGGAAAMLASAGPIGIAAAGVAALGATMALGVRRAMEYQKALSDLKAAAGATDEQMAKLDRTIRTATAGTRFSGAEGAKAAEELVKAGVDVGRLNARDLRAALNFSVAGEMSVTESAEFASGALNTFKNDNLSLERAANIATGAGLASATDPRQISQALAQVGVVAANNDVTFSSLNATLAVFAQNGLKGSDSGTSLKTMLQRLVPMSKSAAEEMQRLGLRFFDAQGRFIGLQRTAGLLKDRLKELTPEQRNAALATIFGSDAVRAATILYREGAEGIASMTEQIEKFSVAQVAATKQDNLIGKWQLFTEVVGKAAEKLGELVTPALESVLDKALRFLGASDQVVKRDANKAALSLNQDEGMLQRLQVLQQQGRLNSPEGVKLQSELAKRMPAGFSFDQSGAAYLTDMAAAEQSLSIRRQSAIRPVSMELDVAKAALAEMRKERDWALRQQASGVDALSGDRITEEQLILSQEFIAKKDQEIADQQAKVDELQQALREVLGFGSSGSRPTTPAATSSLSSANQARAGTAKTRSDSTNVNGAQAAGSVIVNIQRLQAAQQIVVNNYGDKLEPKAVEEAMVKLLVDAIRNTERTTARN